MIMLQILGVIVAAGIFSVGIYHIGKAFYAVLSNSRKENND